MIIVDSSVWIGYFNGETTPETETLDRLLGRAPIALGDLILTEVLQGFRHDRDYRTARDLLTTLETFSLVSQEIAIKSAENYRYLRRLGISIRKTIDTIIATFCIENGFTLLHADKDFEPFATHLDLRVMTGA